MDTYGLQSKGFIILEKLDNKPVWTIHSIGRLIYELSTDKIWIGGTDISDGIKGWIQIGLTYQSVNNYHIDWDIELKFEDNKISAVNIPCFLNNEIYNIQDSLDYLFYNLNEITSGKNIDDNSIKRRHIDLNKENDEGLTAANILILNDKKYFSVTTIELALNYCYEILTNPILPDDTEFGKLIGITEKRLNEILIELEKYIYNLQAINISATYPLSPDLSNVQYILDSLYNYINEVEKLSKLTHNIIDIKGIPDNFGKENQIIRSNGIDGYCLIDLTSNIVKTRYGLVNDTTVQTALDTISGDIASIHNTIDIILLDIADLKIKISEILCQIESIWEKIGILSAAICELWTEIEKIYQQLSLLWEQINLLWQEVCSLWEEIKKIWEVLLTLKSAMKKKKIYFSVMKYTTAWEYGSLKSATDYDSWPAMWLFCDFTNWYNDYKFKYDADVDKNFIVIPIVQFQQFLIPNSFQCYGYLTNTTLGNDINNPRTPVWASWPPITDADSTSNEFLEGGTLGEYPFVLYKGGLGGSTSDGKLSSPPCPKPYYQDNNWIFYLDIGTVAFDNDGVTRAYSGGGRIDYVVYFFGFGYSNDAIMDINNDFSAIVMNAAWKQCSIPNITPGGIIN